MVNSVITSFIRRCLPLLGSLRNYCTTKPSLPAKQKFSLKDKVVLITGGSTGTGFAIAKDLLCLQENAVKGLIVLDKNITPEIIEKFCGFPCRERVCLIRCDVTDLRQLEESYRMGMKKFCALDMVINNASVLNENDLGLTIKTNLMATMYSTHVAVYEYIPRFKSTDEGIVINVSSVMGLTHSKYFPYYVASKHALTGLAFCYGDLFCTTKVRVMNLCPSFTEDDLETAALKQCCVEDVKKLTKQVDFLNPDQCPKAIHKMIECGQPGSTWIANKKLIYQAHIEPAFDFEEILKCK